MPIVKLSYEKVQVIREQMGLVSSEVLAKEYGVCARQIRRIWANTRWNKELYETKN